MSFLTHPSNLFMHSSSFHSTRWTLVRRAQGHGAEAHTALSELCEIYYQPVFQFTRRWCGDADRAQDLAHGFFEDLLGRESIGAAVPLKGRFRTYLLGSVKHYLARLREREGAAGDVAAAGVVLDLSPTALKVAIHRLRQRFRQKVRDEVAATTLDSNETEAEFRHLVDVWVSEAH